MAAFNNRSEDIIKSSKFPAAHAPAPGEVPKIETDYWPGPPSLASIGRETENETSYCSCPIRWRNSEMVQQCNTTSHLSFDYTGGAGFSVAAGTSESCGLFLYFIYCIGHKDKGKHRGDTSRKKTRCLIVGEFFNLFIKEM